MDEYNALGIDDESQWKVLQGKYDAETPVISRMRAELELPFDEAYYNQIIAENHKKQQEYLEAFIQEQAVQLEEDQIQA